MSPEEIAELGFEPTTHGWRALGSEDGSDHEVRTTWAPIDLGPILAGDDLEPPPSMLRRADDAGLIYAGKVHSFAGEPESGKTWLALAACAQAIHAGERVAYVDFEDAAAAVVARLRALGATDEEIRSRFTYVRPDEPLNKAGRDDLDRALVSPPVLAIVDGVTEAMTMLGLDPLSNRDVARFMEQVPRRLARSGAAVVLVDHVVKAKGERGRFAIGAQHKLAGIDGAAYSFEVLRPFGRGLEGVARIEVAKDRPGFVRQVAAGGKLVGDLHLVSCDDGSVLLEIRTAEFGTDDGMAPSRRRVLAVLGGPDRPMSIREIGDAVAQDEQGPPLRRTTIQNSLEELAAEGSTDAERPGNGLPNRWWRSS